MRTVALLLAFLCLSTYGQVTEKSFTSAIKRNIKKYNRDTERAYRCGDVQRADFVFDTLVQKHLAGTRFEDYTLKRIHESNLKLSSIGKPIFIQTFVSWSVLNKGEIVALNKLAKKRRKDFKIIVLFWDRRRDLKEIYPQFSSNIEVCYANEVYNKDAEVLETLKYSVGYIASYLLDSDLNVIGIKKGPAAQIPFKINKKEAIEQNIEAYDNRISILADNSNNLITLQKPT